MEGLMSGRIALISPHCSRHHSPHVPTFPLRLVKNLYKNPLWMMRQFKPFTSVAASVPPLQASVPAHFDNALPSKEVLDIWRNADAVCFDVDSTVCLDEGIDELAEFCGAGKAVAEWTTRVMSGSVPFEQALAARLSV
ncbi:hypothetical protein HHK36_024461 [Tetracentron sinense]|uniref:Phosphoserine phosphatase n=1 Tax=Tetracentron sinense TaxID=13715 RepID=A0A835D6Q6_TETSI|nr:hypothetical protein HHK36_024461 [Tetracentron sinense]